VKRFGLIGYPLTHSFSQKYFSEKFARLGLKDHIYDLFPIDSIEQFPGILNRHPDLVGLNVTIPYKRAVLAFIQHKQLPGNLEAANCIKIQNGLLTAYNTDVLGFEQSFSPLLKPHHQKALVLGNGGATAAVVYVLQKLNIRYNVVSRQLHEGSTLTYGDLNADVIKEHPVIINTTPLGTYPNVNECPSIPYEAITAEHYLFDLVYNPSKTLFLQKGEERGARIKNGYDMLEIQAEESWKIWNS
jgi:shikimate dehydrogenase